jgi:hypothetical protein
MSGIAGFYDGVEIGAVCPGFVNRHRALSGMDREGQPGSVRGGGRICYETFGAQQFARFGAVLLGDVEVFSFAEENAPIGEKVCVENFERSRRRGSPAGNGTVHKGSTKSSPAAPSRYDPSWLNAVNWKFGNRVGMTAVGQPVAATCIIL